MAQADKPNTTSPSRRAVMAGAAAFPALAIIPATAIAAGGVDPIFAAIERHRQIEGAYVAACNEHVEQAREPAREDRVVKLCHRSSNALGELVAMTLIASSSTYTNTNTIGNTTLALQSTMSLGNIVFAANTQTLLTNSCLLYTSRKRRCP